MTGNDGFLIGIATRDAAATKDRFPMLRLTGTPHYYDWGSHTAIPHMLGIPDDPRPLAEIWFGSHPSAPALSVDLSTDMTPAPLDQRLAADPDHWLGPDVHRHFGTGLPFLVKLLATTRALSIQVHPTREQAQHPDAARDARPDAVHHYADPNHKPETLIALSTVHALAGVRSSTQAAADLSLIPGLADIAANLEVNEETHALRTAMESLLVLDDSTVRRCLSELAHLDAPDHPSIVIAQALARSFPGDRGVLASLLLEPRTVSPGQALFIGAGVIHSYLEGFGMEVMANSDNVLRAGLTSKEIDQREFLRVARFDHVEGTVRDLRAQWPAPGSCWLEEDVPVDDFRVRVLELRTSDEFRLPSDCGPVLLIGLEGTACVRDSTTRTSLAPGDSALIAAGESLAVSGPSRLAVISVPSTDHHE